MSRSRRPESRETADHSFYFLVAAALLDGELTPRQFENERWTDPAVIDLMARFICEHRPRKVAELCEFSSDGYRFSASTSSDDVLEFHRKSA